MKLFGKNVELRKFACEIVLIPTLAVTTLATSMGMYKLMLSPGQFPVSFDRAKSDREELMSAIENINTTRARQKHYWDLYQSVEDDHPILESFRQVEGYERERLPYLKRDFYTSVYTNSSLSERALADIIRQYNVENGLSASNTSIYNEHLNRWESHRLSPELAPFIRECQREQGWHRGQEIVVPNQSELNAHQKEFFTFQNARDIGHCAYLKHENPAIQEFRQNRADIAAKITFSLMFAFSVVASIALVSRKKKKPTQKATSKTQPPTPKP